MLFLHWQGMDGASESHGMQIIPVSSKNQLQGMDDLRKEILNVIDNKELCPIVSRVIPKTWADLELEVMKLRDKLNSERKIPILHVKELTSLVEGKIPLDSQAARSALDYYSGVGSINRFKSVRKAENLIFLDPGWLFRLLQLLFRHDHEQNLVFKEEFVDLGCFQSGFNQDKMQLLADGLLSEVLLK